MATLFQCDKCKEIQKDDRAATVELTCYDPDNSILDYRKTYDLCEKCKLEIFKLLK